MCTVGKTVVEICNFGDSVINGQCDTFYKTKKVEKGVAFPTCLSINECVCHMSPLPSESQTLKEGDVVKIDMGVHMDGFIALVAHTLVVQAAPAPVEGPTADVMMAAYTAAQLAGCLMKPGQKNTDVTAALKTVADAYGVNVVQGSLMHQMKRFVIDGNKVVIGREELDQKVEEFEFEANEVYCVDVCMSTGEGKPKDSEERTCVFKRAVDKSYRLKMKASRYVFNEVNTKFPTLPFSIRVLDEKQGRMGVVECLKHELLTPYPVLYEKPGDVVAHFKFTVLILPSGPAQVTLNKGFFDEANIKSEKKLEDEGLLAILKEKSDKAAKAAAKKAAKKAQEEEVSAPRLLSLGSAAG